jgi:carboxyl-terminal processing protease
VAWLRAHTIPLGGPKSRGCADIAPLASVLHGVKVLMLGEASHGDGEAHLERAHIIRCLHERMGFNVLIYEAGLYDATRMDSLLATNVSLDSVAPAALYYMWAQSAQMRPILEYVRRTKSTKSPMTVTGFDVQRTGPEPVIVADIQRWFRAVDSAFFPRAWSDSLDAAILAGAGLTGQKRFQADTKVGALLSSKAPALLGIFRNNEAAFRRILGVRQAGYVQEVVKNMAAYSRMLALYNEPDTARKNTAQLEGANLRERRNSEIMLWLVHERFSGKRVVVWLHNVHAMNSLASAKYGALFADSASDLADATGRLVKRALGDTAYLTGLVTFQGEWGYPGSGTIPVEFSPPGSLARLLHATHRAYAFLNLRPERRDPSHWLNAPLRGTVDAQQPGQYDIAWSRIFDGVLFIDRMTPSMKPSACIQTLSSSAVRRYVLAALDTLQQVSIHRKTYDWAPLRDSVLRRTKHARCRSDAWPVLDWALDRVDHHSFLRAPMPASGVASAPGSAASRPVSGRRVDDRIGYVSVPQFSGPSRSSYIDSLQTLIHDFDSAGVCGWLVDLRGNQGGNMWPMIAGIGPLLGDTIVGSFNVNGNSLRWFYVDGAAWLDDAGRRSDVASGLLPAYRLRNNAVAIAVLTNRRTASSAEATAIAFRGRPHTRSFGDSTAGFASVNNEYRLSDGATMVITVGFNRDRSGIQYPLKLAPDEFVPSSSENLRDAVIGRATAWLLAQASCT